MRASTRGAKPTRLACEMLEDRLTPALAYALTDAATPNLISFDTTTPAAATTIAAVSGIDANEVLVGIDFRPADGLLYGLGVNATANTATLYTINLTTAAATRVGGTTGAVAFTTDGATAVDLPDPAAVGYGFDFNPAADRVRVVAGSLNFRINPDTGAPVDGNNTGTATAVNGINPDAPITGGTTTVDATAYTNSRASTGGPTQQLTIDATTAGNSRLFIQGAVNPPGPNGGVQTLVGTDLGVDFSSVNGFDIPEGATPTTGFAVATVGGVTGLYTIDLVAGTAALVGPVGAGATAVRGFSLAQGGTFQFQTATPTAVEANGNATITLTRTGGATGAINVTVTATAGTATAADFTNASPYTVAFADGQTTATFNIAILDDAVADGPKTVNLAITAVAPVGTAPPGAIGAASAAVLTILDNESVVQFQSAAVSGSEGPAGVDVVLTRTGDLTAATTATVTVVGGSATPDVDFPGGPFTVTFAAGVDTAVLNIPFVNDGLIEGSESVTLAITAAGANTLIGGQSTTTLTIADTVQRFNQAFGSGSGAPLAAVVAGGSTSPTVFNPYEGLGLFGGIRVALGDVNGDGIDDLITINAVGAPLVRVFSGDNGAVLASFLAYPAAFNIPASVAVGDVNGDGFDDIIISTTSTIGAVQVYSGRDFGKLVEFFPFGGLPLGFNVTSGDFNGDGFDDIILGTVSGLSAIGIISGRDFTTQLGIFLPFGNLAVGTTVAAGDLDGDGRLDLVVGTNSFFPAFAVYNGRNITVQSTVVFPFATGSGGANVSIGDVNGDGLPDIIVGPTTGLAVTRAFDGRTLAELNTISPFGAFPGGVFVA